MDKPIRHFVVYKARHLAQMERELAKLQRIRKDIIDASSFTLDGQPTGKGGVSNPTETKALKLLKLGYRIDKLKYEIEAIKGTRDLLDVVQQEIFDDTILYPCNLMDYAAEIKQDYNSFVQKRGKIVRLIAERLGEYYED